MRLVTSVLVILAMVSCQQHHDGRRDASRLQPRHWIQSASLEQLMKQIAVQQNGMQGNLPDDVESPGDFRQSADSVSRLALELSRTARTIPESVNTRSLSDADERAFVGDANTLCDQAIELHDAAREYQVERMQRSMVAIHSTCLSCHSRFRELTGDLEVHSAASGQ